MQETNITITKEIWNGWHIISIKGKFVVKFVAEIRKVLEPFKDQNAPKIALDFTNTTHLDSSAMTLMLNFQNRLKEKNGRMVIFGANEDIMGIITIVGFDSFVPIYKNRADFEKNESPQK
jgi:anti-anti-sigma factor